MNLKKKGLLLGVAVMVLCGVVVYVFFFPKEPFQEKPTGDAMEHVEKFCDQHFGKEWGVDHVFRYNDRILFVAVNTQGAVVDLSVHPENRIILIENIKGPVLLKKRIYRF